MRSYVGMYVHMHWGYNRPYNARTWTVDDWKSYASGLAGLGFNMVMIWPMVETMPDPPTESDVASMAKLGRVIDMLRADYGMHVVITLCPNVLGNEKAASFTFEERPYFVTDRRFDPADKAEMDRMMRFRRGILAHVANADGYSVIDSDPGGWIGSTNDDFIEVLRRHNEMAKDLNPEAVLYYWMLVGWEAYNRFWQSVRDTRAAKLEWSPADCEAAVRGMLEWPDQSWGLLACADEHREIAGRLDVLDRTFHFPYGLVEGEPSFPLTNCSSESIHQGLQPFVGSGMAGCIANSQTHCVQQPNTYLFAHFARGGRPENVDLPGLADGLVPGHADLIADAWQTLQIRDPGHSRDLARRLRAAASATPVPGDLGGLLIGTCERFLTDLAMQLDFRADARDFAAAVEEERDWKPALARLVESWGTWQRQTGFADACGIAGGEHLMQAIHKLGTASVLEAMAGFGSWENPPLRHGVIPRLIAALSVASSSGRAPPPSGSHSP